MIIVHDNLPLQCTQLQLLIEKMNFAFCSSMTLSYFQDRSNLRKCFSCHQCTWPTQHQNIQLGTHSSLLNTKFHNQMCHLCRDNSFDYCQVWLFGCCLKSSTYSYTECNVWSASNEIEKTIDHAWIKCWIHFYACCITTQFYWGTHRSGSVFLRV